MDPRGITHPFSVHCGPSTMALHVAIVSSVACNGKLHSVAVAGQSGTITRHDHGPLSLRLTAYGHTYIVPTAVSVSPSSPSPSYTKLTFRERVAGHQCHALHGVGKVRGHLIMLPRYPLLPPTLSAVILAWYTNLRPQQVQLNPMDTTLHDPVWYTLGQSYPCPHETLPKLVATFCKAAHTGRQHGTSEMQV